MIKTRTALSLTGAFLLTAMSLPVLSQNTYAQEGSGSGLRVSPTRTLLTIDPGESDTVTQTVKNVTSSPVTVQPLLNDFESDGVSGEPRLIGNPDEVSAHSLRDFVSLPEDFDLQPDEEKQVEVGLDLPGSASPGAYYGSILYRAAPQGERGDGQVALVASVGSLILLEVPGDITEQIAIKDIGAYLGDSKGSFFLKKPDNLGVLVENLGNGFSQPFGKVSVKDWRGNEIFLYELNEGPPRNNILPYSTRLFTNEFMDIESKTVNGKEEITKTSPITWPGRYTITGNISHGSSGELFTVTSTFWYIPSWLILLILIVVAVLAGVVFYLFRKYRVRSVHRKR